MSKGISSVAPGLVPFGGVGPPRAPLGLFPTAVEPLEALSSQLGVEMWVKREDRSGPLYGGNKVRKLEWLLGAAKASGASTVLTVGTLGSHHVLATALYSRHLDLACHALLYPQHMTPHAAETLRHTAAAAPRLTWASSPLTAPMMGLVAIARATDWEHRRLPSIISPGGSSPLGVLGDVGAGFELAGQIRDGLLPEPRWLIVPLGSGGTTAGLALGITWAGLRTRILAVRAVHALFANRRAVGRLIAGTVRLLRSHGAAPPTPADALSRVEVDGRWYGPGYAQPNPQGQAAAARIGDRLALDPTYTQKAAAALIARAPSLGGPLLFWDTVSSVLPPPRDLPMPAASLPSGIRRALTLTSTDREVR